MKNKFLKLAVFVLLLGVISFGAGVNAEFKQFLVGDTSLYDKAGAPLTAAWQFWEPAKMITLNVKGGTTVFLTNYVSNWYGDMPNLGDDDYAAGYDMSAGQYGYVYAQKDADGKVTPVGDIHYANGETIEVTYKNPTGPETRTTTGYLLDNFTEDAEIFFVMTPRGYEDETNNEVNSFGPVNDPDGPVPYESILASRQINTTDQTAAVRVNFGTTDGVGHEFLIGYVAEPPSAGQPLPGALFSGLLIFGMASVSRLRKKTRK